MTDHKQHLKIVKPTTEAQKATRTTMDCIIVTPPLVKSWKLPSFQRPLKVNDKVMAVMREIAETHVIPGVITLGIINRETFIVDGQHRREAFLLSDVPEGFADVRYTHFETEAEMADEFIKVNQRLVNLKPDDILRGLEKSNKGLQRIRRECPWVGYDQVRRNEKTSPVVSMSALLRCWFGSSPETPALGGLTAAAVIENHTSDEVDTLIGFCELAYKAWGRDGEHARLWANLNLCICMWMYRRLVITAYSPSIQKITKDQFTKCLMTVSAESSYNDWLLGRQLRERDRSPAYSRLKALFARRIEDETGKKPRLPAPAWGKGSHNH